MSPAKYDILLLDDGELAEIRAAAQSLDAAVHGDMDAPGTPVEWPLVVANARNLPTLESIPVNLSAKRVVVVDQLSQTLRARMRRARVDFFLCRPVHPEALRLLLLHCLYSGPERRQYRVAVGAPVKFRSGFRRGRGVLADLSDTGCRILTPEPLAPRQKLLVFLPRAGRPGRTFFVRAEVVRVTESGEPPHQMALRFSGLANAARRRIAELIARYREGPAVFRDDVDASVASRPTEERGPEAAPHLETREASAAEGVEPWRAAASAGIDPEPLETDEWPTGGFPTPLEDEAALPPRSEEAFIPEERAAAARAVRAPAAQAPQEERRREPRRAFHRHVVALDRTATRVLIGRDLSVGGMRVDPNPALMPLKTFRLSIHVGEGELPLVVRARVVRDDGEAGMVLRFEQLGFAVQEHLRKSLRELPILAPGGDGGAERVLVTEILEDGAEGWPPPRSGGMAS